MIDVKKMKKVDKTLTIADRIAFLEYCANEYELGTSPISDYEYDNEYYELENLDPDNPFFESVGGIDEHIHGTLVEHNIIMGSLAKCRNFDQFKDWLCKTFKGNINSLVLQHKIDGLSMSLHYSNGKLKQVLTRGNGFKGVDVTNNALHVKGVLPSIPTMGEVEIRGECYKNRQDFYKNWHISVLKNGYMNPRNFTPGSLNQLDPLITAQRGLSFVAYEEVRLKHVTEIDKLLFMKNNGFETALPVTRKTKEGLSVDEIVKAVNIYMDAIDRSNLEYDIDGIVVKTNDIEFGKKMGSTARGKRPKSSVAVKFKPEIKETKIIGVEANVKRTGIAVPVYILESFELCGTMVDRATAHNFGALIKNHQYGIGSRVLVEKAGDIIPQIKEFLSVKTQDWSLPKKCYSCGTDFQWNETKVHLICPNPSCPAQASAKINHWCKALGIKGVGQKTFNRLCDMNDLQWEGRSIIVRLSDIYYMLDNDRLSEHPFRKYAYLKEQLGEKKFQNIVDAIHKVKRVPLHTFIEALGIAQIGSKAKEIVAIAPSIEEINNLSIEQLTVLKDFGKITATNFFNGWKSFQKDIEIICKYVDVFVDNGVSNILKGQSFCFTGSFSNPSRTEMEKLVGDHGGQLSSVSKKLTALVWDGETTKGKYEKAKSLNIPIIDQDEFLKKIQ